MYIYMLNSKDEYSLPLLNSKIWFKHNLVHMYNLSNLIREGNFEPYLNFLTF